jgi:hypothetical protein
MVFPGAPVAVNVAVPGRATAGIVTDRENVPFEATGTAVATVVVVTSVNVMLTVWPEVKLAPETVTGQPALTLVADSEM